MSPDDSRHGSYAGYMAHRKDSERPCEPCRLAERRKMKLWRVLGSSIVPLGEEAHDLVCAMPMIAFSAATGLGHSHLRKLRRSGPEARVQRTTRDAILAAQKPMTVLGARRRLQALACLGWSSIVIAERYGMHADNLNMLRRGDREHYIRRGFAARIAAAYDDLHMEPAPRGRGATWAQGYAAKNGWVPPLAWDDIDDPDEKPKGITRQHKSRSDVDEVAVARTLEGRKPPGLTRAEVDEVVRRWQSSGRSQEECERFTGINASRVLKRLRETA